MPVLLYFKGDLDGKRQKDEKGKSQLQEEGMFEKN